ncbi:MAG: PLP-dependent transferase [Trueperaceae bacterium]|nr:PLP-dependent transferase [Trueperaceae bacterium]
MRSLVVGVGDWEKGDEAAALEVARRVAESAPEGVTAIGWEGSAIDLIDRWKGFDRVVLVCAAGPDTKEGHIVPIALGPEVAHACPDVARALAVAEDSDRLPARFEAAAIGVVRDPASQHHPAANGAGVLSPPVARAARLLAERIRTTLASGLPLALDTPPPRTVPSAATLAAWTTLTVHDGPQAAVETTIRSWEGADACLAFVTGEAAVRAALHVARSDTPRVVAVLDPTSVAARTLDAHGVDVRTVAADEPGAIEAAIDDGLDQLWLTSPAGAHVRVLDLARLTHRAAGEGAVTVFDATGAGAVPPHALALGADLVVYADVSALAGTGADGHLRGGLLTGDAELIAAAARERDRTDTHMRHEAAEQLLVGFRTLPLRAERSAANALALARHLKRHPRVRDVAYPGLPSHPDGARVPETGPSRWGPTLAFTAIAAEEPRAVLDGLRWVRCGDVGALPDGVATYCTALGPAPDGGFRYRLTCGIEDAEDLIDDVDLALSLV